MKATDPAKIFAEVCTYPEGADAILDDRVAVLFFPGVSLKTFKRRCPAPEVKFSERKRGRRLKHLRAIVRGKSIT